MWVLGQCKLSELGTAEFCLFFNDLFDTCNVSKEDKTGLRCRITQNSPHLTFWDEAIYVLESVRFVIYVNGFPSKIAKLMNKHREPKRSMSNSNGKESFVLVNEGFSVETIEPEVPKNLLPELLECQKLVTKLNILQEANKNKIKKRKSGGSLEQSISELRKLYKSSPLPISELKETQTLVPDFIRLWILNCYGFKALVNNLREAGITEVYTKYFNVDNIQDFMKKIRIANGMESLEVTENAEYPLLDPEMAKCALRPMVGCIILRN